MTFDANMPFLPTTGRLRGSFAGCEIGQPLGGGGMAVVYEARDTATGARLALKLVLRQTGLDAAVLLEAEREGAALQEYLSEVDDRVARIYRYGEEGDYFFVQMELVEGQDLSHLLERGPLPAAEALRIAIDVGEVLRNAHALEGRFEGTEFRGVVHGDIKPRNIRITPDGKVKVLDFGIAKALSLSRRLTRNEFGSLHYASPERLESGTVDERSDLWSLGVVLYEMLAGRLPYRAENEERLERVIRARRPAPPLEGCAPSLRRVVEKALDPRLEHRYNDADAMLADLRAVVEGRSTAADRTFEDAATRGTSATPSSIDDNATRTTSLEPPSDVIDDATHRTSLDLRPGADEDATRRTSLDPRPGADEDATRRTSLAGRPGADDDATRRTMAPSPGPVRRSVEEETGPLRSAPAATVGDAVAAWTFAAPPESATDTYGRRRRIAFRIVIVAAAAAILWASLALLGQWRIVGQAQSLAADLAAARVTREQAFAEHQRLTERAWTPLFVQALRRALLTSYASVADAVIEEYRSSDSPLVRERDWRRAADAIASAQQLDPRDRKLRARRELIEGHLLRIDLRAGRGDPAHAQEAIRRFKSAAEDAGGVDPYLGLAALHAYVQHDVEQTDAAVEKIAKEGLQPGRRERAERADARLLSATDLWAARRSVTGLPEEKTYLERIRTQLSQAVDLYGSVLGFENAKANLRKARGLIDQVDAKLAAIEAERSRRMNPLRWLFSLGSGDEPAPAPAPEDR